MHSPATHGWRSIPLCSAAGLVVLGGLGWTLIAPRLSTGSEEGQQTPVTEASRSGDPADEHRSERMLLLVSGRVVSGQIIKSGDNYTVRKPTGEMFIPGSQVRMECQDLRDCYRKLQSQLPGEQPARERYQLANWCLKMQMMNEARNELQAAVMIDSTYLEARELLSKLDAILDPDSKSNPEPKSNAPDGASKAILRAHYGINDIQILGGLSRDQAREFTERIQPILLNNCTRAGCHGGHSDSALKLEKPAPGSPSGKRQTERNLNTLLKYIDRKDPLNSDLLSPASGPHPDGKPFVIPGSRGKQQLKDLKAWVLSLKSNEPAPRLARKKDSASRAHAQISSHAGSASTSGRTAGTSERSPSGLALKNGLQPGGVFDRSTNRIARTSGTADASESGVQTLDLTDLSPNSEQQIDEASAASTDGEQPADEVSDQAESAADNSRSPSDKGNGDPFDPDQFNSLPR